MCGVDVGGTRNRAVGWRGGFKILYITRSGVRKGVKICSLRRREFAGLVAIAVTIISNI